MPELPEVEVVRQGIAQWVVGRTIQRIDVKHPRAVRRQHGGAREFIARLSGRRVVDSNRRGKFMWLVLDNDEALVIHLGMSGQVLIQPNDMLAETHLRVKVQFTDGDYAMHFVDQRTFGWMLVEELVADSSGEFVPECALHIALDPLDRNWDLDQVAHAIVQKQSEIKRVILDQSVVSGIGNIYADESLWRAKLHWGTPANRLTHEQVVQLLLHAQEVMVEALKVGGTSFDALYVNVNGESGYFSRDLNAYGQEDEPCSRCGTLIVREAFANRSSFRCPACQPVTW